MRLYRITGKPYTDLVHMYSLCAAGYIPQLFNSRMMASGQIVVADLLAMTGGKALLYDIALAEFAEKCPLPKFKLLDEASLPEDVPPLPPLPDVEITDMAMIFHTSGTTSGKPKPVPETHAWLKCQAQVQWTGMWHKDALMFNNLGSFANVGSATSKSSPNLFDSNLLIMSSAMSYLVYSGQCLIQTTKSDFDATEFLALVKEGMNAMLLYAPWLSKLSSIARTNSDVLAAMRGMAQITYTGASLNPEDEQWLISRGVTVAVCHPPLRFMLLLILVASACTRPQRQVTIIPLPPLSYSSYQAAS
jgi:acyl-CoA synthetase (AMP-forming)/AMP-acid ligase II